MLVLPRYHECYFHMSWEATYATYSRLLCTNQTRCLHFEYKTKETNIDNIDNMEMLAKTFEELMLEKVSQAETYTISFQSSMLLVQGVGSTPLCCGKYNTKELYTEVVNMCDSFHKQILGKLCFEYSEIQNSVNNRNHCQEHLAKESSKSVLPQLLQIN